MGVDGVVEAEVAVLLADRAADGLDLARERVDDHARGLQRLGTVIIGLRHAVGVGIDIVHDLLNERIDAGIDLIAAVVEKLARRGFGQAKPRLQVAQNVVDDHFHIIGIDLLLVDLVLAADEVQLVVIDLRDGGDVFLVGDVVLVVHLVENGLGALLVVLHAGKGAVARGVVRDADDACALREREFPHVLSEVGVRGHLHAACALAEVDDVEIPLHDLFLGIFLFEIESAENLHELSLHGDVVLGGDVFDELLRDR